MKDLDKKCRLCLKIGSEMEHLFRNPSGDTYAEILYDVLKIEVNEYILILYSKPNPHLQFAGRRQSYLASYGLFRVHHSSS